MSSRSVVISGLYPLARHITRGGSYGRLTGVTVVVVGAVVVDRGCLLAGQRSGPPELAGFWELPGGKVEPGEGERAALARECREELGVEVEVGERVGDDLPVAGRDGILRVYAVRIVGDAEPRALDHRELRWLGAQDLDEVAWLATNRPLLPVLARLLRG